MLVRMAAGHRARALALALVYVACARLGLLLDAVSGFATLVWAPTGISLAALLLFGTRLWPGVALGAFATNLWIGAPLPVAAAIALGNTLEAVVAARGLSALGFDPSLRRLRDALLLLGVAGVGSTMLSATIGVASLVAGGVAQPAAALATWRAWWLGDLVGDFVVAPLLLLWLARQGPARRSPAEAGVFAVGLALTTCLVFFGPRGAPPALRQAHLVLPLLLWAAVRFSQRGVATSLFLVCALAIAGTALGQGPFSDTRLSQRLELLQTFLAVAAAAVLVLGAVMAERQQLLLDRQEILNVVSHDLRGPLGSMKLAAEALARSLPEGETSPRRGIAIIQRAASRMEALIGDLLDAGAIDAGKLSVVLKVEATQSLLEEACELTRPLATEYGHRLEISPADQPATVLCDRRRILQALVNLIGNAIHHTPVGGHIAVKVEEMPACVRFSVSDTGPGIPGDQLSQLFEAYRRGDGAAGGGYGLGLHIVRGIALAHGGAVDASSDPGRGSTFRLTLPRPPDQAPGA